MATQKLVLGIITDSDNRKDRGEHWHTYLVVAGEPITGTCVASVFCCPGTSENPPQSKLQTHFVEPTEESAMRAAVDHLKARHGKVYEVDA